MEQQTTADLKALTARNFEPLLGDTFCLDGPTGQLKLELTEIRKLGQAVRPEGAFSLIFISPAGRFLPQAIYPLTHPTLGRLDVFIVPLGPVQGANGYEVIFT